MAGQFLAAVFLSFSMLSPLSGGSFDPFMDQTMFMIDWNGPLLDSLPKEQADNVVVMTKDQEQYQCILPEVYGKKSQETVDSYQGPTATDLIHTLFHQTTCSYRLESYWTYELCHGKHLRQYHEVKEQGKKPRLQEYFLGFGHSNAETSKSDDSAGSGETPESTPASKEGGAEDKNIKHRRVDGVDLPYYEVVMQDGTPCDLTQQPRATRVLYVCQPDGHGEVYELKETSTCEYEVMVLTSVLCSHPLFRPKNPPVNKISCHALSGAPVKPHTLEKWEQESSRLASSHQESLFGTQEPEEFVKEPEEPTRARIPKVITSKTSPVHDTSTVINKLTDKQVLRELISGDYCLQGGVGWWKHEICIGRYARQFHKDKTGETNIYLGRFNEEHHLQWLAEHPNKRPKPVGQRKFLYFMYTGGDVCDVTGKPRKVEVRLKCIDKTEHGSTHSLSLSLTEPVTCEYILLVESLLLCDLMDQADENGLLKSINL
ncbi:endoplasmic reticulum lectin 1-like isoform X2 [Babylonia areolata]|uniref:endoplasmic reticulum lectin 1-like isoform X2 n=1 Tax=Babylonia areolata TaxID=304850 RepID=UPI003FD004F7